MQNKLKIFKIALLNDLLDLELTDINDKQILNPVTASKFRNLKKSTKAFVKFSDEELKKSEIQEAFGDFSDKVNELIDEYLKQLK